MPGTFDMPASANNATATADAFGFTQAAGSSGLDATLSRLRREPCAFSYGVRDFSPALGAENLFSASLSGTGAEGFSETSPDGAFFENREYIPHTAINRLRESGDESPHSKLDALFAEPPAVGGIGRSPTESRRGQSGGGGGG
ncbi:MAG: hypothetical protein LBD14_03550, partial [Puniceicoccales bacterium]|nr:hypothetical protein [Puniceicoccales bacterium]